MKYRFLLVVTLCLLTGKIAHASKSEQSVPVMETAAGSKFYGTLNKIQAAELLEKIITEGQQQRIMLKYIGIDPRILATIHTDQIQIRFRHFTGFTQNPVTWSREGAKMKDFLAKWTAVSNITASLISDDEGIKYYTVSLYKDDGYTSTLIPLHENPAGYTISDTLLATLVLQGAIPAANNTLRNIPLPSMSQTSSNIPATPTPTPLAAATVQPPQATPTCQPAPTLEPISATPTPMPEIQQKAPLPEAALPAKIQAQPATIRQKLEILKQLYEEGLINDNVYEEKQRAILEKL